MDVFSSSIFTHSNNNIDKTNDVSQEREDSVCERKSSVLSEALHDIEHNFRSLFWSNLCYIKNILF